MTGIKYLLSGSVEKSTLTEVLTNISYICYIYRNKINKFLTESLRSILKFDYKEWENVS